MPETDTTDLLTELHTLRSFARRVKARADDLRDIHTATFLAEIDATATEAINFQNGTHKGTGGGGV